MTKMDLIKAQNVCIYLGLLCLCVCVCVSVCVLIDAFMCVGGFSCVRVCGPYVYMLGNG